uniref:Zinc finger PHD-type domain-containing protein n=1 Tax=Leersia perrieri TaxID=77586 RepID=A0A0D9XUH6_9ORYZ
MASSSRPKFRYKNPQEMPHRSQNGHPTVLQTSLTLGNQLQARWLHSDSGMSASGKAVHMELSKSSDPAAERTTQDKEKEVITDYPSNVQQIYMAFQIPAELSVWDVVKGNVNHIANIMKAMQERPLALLKVRVRELVEEGDRKGNCEFQNLHKFIQDRSDLTHTMLLAAHHVQLEILVAIKTGVPAFLHENLTIPKSNLVEIFFYQRCRNISCGNPLPAEGCDCLWCSRRGFCNLCMCLICDKYDFNYNTCRWIGCAGCSHWTHAECAVREGKSRTALAAKNGTPYIQTLYSCMACQETSEMFGFVKDVVQKCGKFWDRDTLLSELECVHKMFSASIDPKGKKFFMKCAELIERLKTVPAEPMSPNILLQALEEKERLQKVKAAFRAWVQREHAEVQERKKAMSLAAAEKERVEQKTKTEAEISGKALAWYTQMQLMKENAKKLDERIIAEQLRSKQEVEEMERAVNMKAAEAEMFRVKAEEAKKEAEQLKTMAMAKKQIHTVAEKTYTDWYLKHRMEEAEAEKRFLFHSLRSYEESINQQLALSLAPPVATTSTPAPPPPSVMVSAAAAAAAAAGPSGSGGCGGGALLSRIMEVLNRMPPRAP